MSAHHFSLAQSSNPAAQQRNPRPWYEAYDEGLRNIQQQRWQQAIDSLLAAMAARKQQGRRVAFYGDRVDAYVPDYYLGVAYTELGRFTEAEAAFQRVTDQRLVVQGDRTFQNFQATATRARTGALARGSGAQGPQQTAGITTTPPPAGRGADTTPTQSPVQSPVPPPAQNPETQVATGPGPATTNPTTPGPANPAANQAANTTTPSPILPRVTVPDVRGLLEAEARRRLAASGLSTSLGPRRITAAVAPGTVTAQVPQPGALVTPRTRVSLSLTTPPAAARASETDAIAAFFTGDYATAGQILETIITVNGKDAPASSRRAWLFLASSITAQVLTGDRDRAELEAARGLLAKAGPLEQFASDRRLISPRIWAALGVPQ